MSTVDDRAFELWAMETLEGNPTEIWETISSLWNNLALAEKPVRERLLRRMADLIAERSTSATLYQLIEDVRSMAPAPTARALPHDIALFREAAEYSRRHPERWVRRFVLHAKGRLDESTIRKWIRVYGFEFDQAAQKPGVPDSQIFSPVIFEPVSLKGEGTLTVNERVIQGADRT
jgi:hypothetical protein